MKAKRSSLPSLLTGTGTVKRALLTYVLLIRRNFTTIITFIGTKGTSNNLLEN